MPNTFENIKVISNNRAIQPVYPKGDQSWVFIGRTDVEAETPIFWPPDAKSWLIGKDPDAEKDWGQEETGTTEDKIVGWHHRLDGHGFGWTPGVGDGQGGLACCSSWGHKESDTTEQLNWTLFSVLEHWIRVPTSTFTHPVIWGGQVKMVISFLIREIGSTIAIQLQVRRLT